MQVTMDLKDTCRQLKHVKFILCKRGDYCTFEISESTSLGPDGANPFGNFENLESPYGNKRKEMAINASDTNRNRMKYYTAI